MAQPIVDKPQQFLIRFDHRTYVYNWSDASDVVSPQTQAIAFLSSLTGWPERYLQIAHWDLPSISIRVRGQIRGGKGGFGTLLKGQSRQAGAKVTTDFGACRDLQGRRLRQVNEAIDYKLWKEWNDKVQAGSATEEEMTKALLDTRSGIAGWHLQLPRWADVSANKEQRKWQRKFHQWKRDRAAEVAAASEKKRLQEEVASTYVRGTEAASAKVISGLQSALEEGLRHRNKRRKNEPDPPTALVTLQGDVTLAYGDNDRWQMQSQSNFCTVGIVLDQEKAESALYYEVLVVTGGLVQIGWATRAFRPCSETGDGVGDCSESWAYDGSRNIRLHGTQTDEYGSEWKAGDVIGCRYGMGRISYFLNGKDLGTAFEISVPSYRLFPAISCNPGEIVELHLHREEFWDKSQASFTAVGDVLATESILLGDDHDEPDPEEPVITASSHYPTTEVQQSTQEAKVSKETQPVVVEPLDLNCFSSAAELEMLGLDRLKGALMAINVKCGGTLQERASRLFSLKGLDPSEYPKNF